MKYYKQDCQGFNKNVTSSFDPHLEKKILKSHYDPHLTGPVMCLKFKML